MSDGALSTGAGGIQAADDAYHGHRRRVRRRRRSPRVAEFLSFVWPGLGQAYARRPWVAIAFAVPPAVLLLAFLVVAITAPGTFALNLLAPAFALAVITAIGFHGVWRSVSILHAWRITQDGSGRRYQSLPLAVVLSAVVLIAHAAAGVYVQSFADAGSKIFTGARPAGPDDIDSILGGNPISSPSALESPGASPGYNGLPGDTNGDGVVDGNDIIPGDTNGDGVVDGNDDPETDPGDGTDDPGGTPSAGPGASPPPFDPGGVPTGSLPEAGPINVLFIGLDSSLDRSHSLSDSLIVASYYPERGTLTMISFPRDTGRFPLYKGGTYPNRINSFLGYAKGNTSLFPEGPVAALMHELGYLLGSPIQFYAATNIDGLPQAVDAVGGVDVVVDRPIADPVSELYLDPGPYHLDGPQALVFARSRHGPNNDDWKRAGRQQDVLVALAQRLKDPTVALNLPDVIHALSAVVRTNVPPDQIPVLLSILQKANDAPTEHVVLSTTNGYATRIPAAEINGRYMIEPDIAAIRELSMRIFGSFSSYR